MYITNLSIIGKCSIYIYIVSLARAWRNIFLRIWQLLAQWDHETWYNIILLSAKSRETNEFSVVLQSIAPRIFYSCYAFMILIINNNKDTRNFN